MLASGWAWAAIVARVAARATLQRRSSPGVVRGVGYGRRTTTMIDPFSDVAAETALIADAAIAAAHKCEHRAVTVRRVLLRRGFYAACDKCGERGPFRPNRAAAIAALCGLRETTGL